MKQFIVRILSVSAGLVIIGWLVFSFFLPEHYLKVLPFTLLFFLVVTILVHAWQLRMAKKDLARFTRSNMLLTFFKLVLYSIFAVVYIANDRENALVFVVCLVIIYIAFSYIEVSELSRRTQKK